MLPYGYGVGIHLLYLHYSKQSFKILSPDLVHNVTFSQREIYSKNSLFLLDSPPQSCDKSLFKRLLSVFASAFQGEKVCFPFPPSFLISHSEIRQIVSPRFIKHGPTCVQCHKEVCAKRFAVHVKKKTAAHANIITTSPPADDDGGSKLKRIAFS